MPGKLKVADSFNSRYRAVLLRNDCRKALETLPAKHFKLVLTSPPYNVGKSYEKRMTLDEYLSFVKGVIEKLVRVMRDDGSLCWQVGNHVSDGKVVPLDILTYPVMEELGLKLRNRIIWRFGHGLHASKRFSGRYETLLWFTKSDAYTFNLDPVRVKQKYPGKRHSKGALKGEPSGNKNGKNPSDFWEFGPREWRDGIWNFPNVKSNHPEKSEHPCQFPIELAERCILALSNEHDAVLDPFLGSGTTAVASVLHNRRVVGIEKYARYISLAKTRVQKALTGELSRRELGRPIHQPTGTERVARVPDEWIEDRQRKGHR